MCIGFIKQLADVMSLALKLKTRCETITLAQHVLFLFLHELDCYFDDLLLHLKRGG